MGSDHCVMTNEFRTIYIGVPGDLPGRVSEHRQELTPGFTSCYGLDRLAYYEVHGRPAPAIQREKQLRGGGRSRRIALSYGLNPTREDLAKDWYWVHPGLQGGDTR